MSSPSRAPRKRHRSDPSARIGSFRVTPTWSARSGARSSNVVVDVVGGAQWPAAARHPQARRPSTRSAGAIAGPVVALDLRTLYLKDLRLLGCTILDPAVFRQPRRLHRARRDQAGVVEDLPAAADRAWPSRNSSARPTRARSSSSPDRPVNRTPHGVANPCATDTSASATSAPQLAGSLLREGLPLTVTDLEQGCWRRLAGAWRSVGGFPKAVASASDCRHHLPAVADRDRRRSCAAPTASWRDSVAAAPGSR